MGLMRNKRGIFFTILAIIIITLFALSFTINNNMHERKAIEKRISTMNSFLESTEIDLSRKVYIFGYRIIFLTEKKIVDSGSYINDFNATVQEAFFNGTIQQQQQDLLQGVTYNDIIYDINQTANRLNVNFVLSSAAIKVEQVSPWEVSFTLTGNLQMKDKSNLASWNKTVSMSSNVLIDTFEDPIYYINTQGFVTNNITKTPFAVFVSGSNISNLSTHALNSYYKESINAPSFIQRLEGKNIPDQFGIESLVNLQKLSQQGVHVYDKSVIDYIYFSSQNPAPLCTITGMPSWFKVDQSNAASYNISC
jgi:hypothetical protein